MREAPALRVGPMPLQVGAASGALAGLSFVVKDVIDVRGVATGAGSPMWLREQEPARQSASVVSMLTDAGATCIGKAHTDELAYSLAGSNAHYGAPPNPAAAGRFTGGSSSGSASAVAAGIANLALGTDTGGSIRVPASYCGLVGFRPSHGRIDTAGVVPLAPTFDTVGVLGRTLEPTASAATVLLRGAGVATAFTRVVVMDAAFAVCEPDVAAAVELAARDLAERWGLPVVRGDAGSASLSEGARAFTVLQGREAWAAHGGFVRRHGEAMGADVAARFRAGSEVADEDWRRAHSLRERLRIDAAALLDGALLVLPSAPSAAPLHTDAGAEVAQARRAALLQLTCLAGLIGAPALSLPLAAAGGAPVGVGLVSAPGTDETLLRAATEGAGPLMEGQRR